MTAARESRTPLRVGVVGTGMVMQLAHLPAIARTPLLRLAAVAGHDTEVARALAHRYGCENVYADHATMLDHADIDAVVVATHRRSMADVVLDALSTGRHVLSEKPMAMTLETACKLSDLAGHAGLVYAVGFMKRYDEGVARAKRLLADLVSTGRLGRLVHVCGTNFCAEYVGHCEDYLTSGRARSEPPAPVVPAWLDPAQARCYDWLANVGLHSLNLLRFLLDDRLSLRHAALAFDNAASILLETRGVPVALSLGRTATGKWEERLDFYFERGKLGLALTSLKQRDRCAAITLDENVGEPVSLRHGHDALSAWSFTHQMRAFAETIAGRPESLLTSASDSVRDMEILEEIFSEGKVS